MKKKILLAIILLAIFFSVLSLSERFVLERENKQVELILDSQNLFYLKQNTAGQSMKDILQELKKAGLTGIALHKRELTEYIDDGEIFFFTEAELTQQELLTGNINPLFTEYNLKKGSVFLYAESTAGRNILDEFADFLQLEKLKFDYREFENFLILYISDWRDDLLNKSFYPEYLIEDIENKNLKIVPVFTDLKEDRSFINKFYGEFQTEIFLFSGRGVAHFDENKKDVKEETVSKMRENDIQLAIIEPFLAPQGVSLAMAPLLDYNVLRTHIILNREMAVLSRDTIVSRYIRAVRERNVRLLYLRIFPDHQKNKGLLEINTSYLENLKENLLLNNFSINNAAAFSFFHNPDYILFIIWSGIIAAGIFLMQYFFNRSQGSYAWFFLLLAGIFIQVILLYFEQDIFFRQIMALAASVIFPSLAIISQVCKGEKHVFIKTVLISLTGALFVAAALNHTSFLLQIERFRGVKLAFALPLLLVGIFLGKEYLQNSEENIQNQFKSLLELPLKLKHLFIVVSVLLFAAFYIMRTGNFPMIAASALEARLRFLLEEIIGVRPRFKEFLLGYPFLILSIYFRDKIKKPFVFFILVIIAVIAPVNMINSFAHIHTPLYISLLRSLSGLLSGVIVGLFILFLYKIVNKYSKSRLFAGGK